MHYHRCTLLSRGVGYVREVDADVHRFHILHKLGAIWVAVSNIRQDVMQEITAISEYPLVKPLAGFMKVRRLEANVSDEPDTTSNTVRQGSAMTGAL